MAGLAAARTLAEAGRGVLIFEATDRVGGRILTHRKGPRAGSRESSQEIVELGAEFVHGRPPDLLALIAEAGLNLYERTGDFLQLHDGKLNPGEDDGQDREGILNALENYTGPDQSFAQYVATLGLPGSQREAEIAYVEGFNAADAAEVSVLALGRQQAAEDAIDGHRVFRVREGYDRVPQFLWHKAQAAGAELRLNTAATEVLWHPDHVEVRAGAETFHAAQAVIALPLSILQAGKVAVTPQPTGLDMTGLRMGHACRFTFRFREPLWPPGMSFLLTPRLMPRVWWTAHPQPEAHPTLTGWVGGPSARSMLALSAPALRREAIAAVAAAFSRPAAEVSAATLSFHALNWSANPASQGAYSWVRAGGLAAAATWSQPCANTLFFAGEHTCTTGHWGTVHAAYRSGLRAAAQIIANVPHSSRPYHDEWVHP